jgi:hypothetical protein
MKPHKAPLSLNRRELLAKTLGATGAVAAASLLPGAGLFVPPAAAQSASGNAVLVIFLRGGYNALFGSADSFNGAGVFGVNNANMLALGNGLVVDSSFGQLSTFARQHMASVGVLHGIAAHGGAQQAHFTVGNANPVVKLADAMGGTGSIPCAVVGSSMPPGPRGTVGSVSLQQVTDMQATINAMGGGAPDPTMPKRELAALGVTASRDMSAPPLGGNPESLATVREGYDVAVATLTTPAKPFNPQELLQAYGLQGTTVDSFAAQMAAAELMIRAGSSVVTAVDGQALTWDTHGDRTGARARQLFTTRVLPGLKAFTDRMVTEEGNSKVTVVIFGDFARSTPGSDHANVTVATVIGPNVNQGTTGRVSASVGLPQGTPGIDALWGYVAALAEAPEAVRAFGGNPHQAISKV